MFDGKPDRCRQDNLVFHIITGALGSGKTTLLNSVLQSPAMRDAFVLVNEFGAIGVDHTLIAEVTDSVILLESGCACCVMSGDLRDELVKIVDQCRAGTWAWGHHIVLETTGLADPLPILKLLTSDEVLRDYFVLGHVLTVVDALRNYKAHVADPAYDNQIALADIIVVTKTQLAAAADQHRVRHMLANMNPLAEIFEFVADAGMGTEIACALCSGATGLKPADFDKAPAGAHLETTASFGLELNGPVAPARFLNWLQLLAQSFGEDLLRIKGAVPFETGWADINGYGTVMHTPVAVTARPCVLPGKLIVIARNLQQAALQRSLNWACYGDVTTPPTLCHLVGRMASRGPDGIQGTVNEVNNLRSLFPQAQVQAISPVLRWNMHNPWSLAGQGAWAWPLLGLLESSGMVDVVSGLLHGNVTLVSSEIITPETHWLLHQQGMMVADEGRHVPVDGHRCISLKIRLWGEVTWSGDMARHDLTRPVALGNQDGNWAVLSIIYCDATARFSRSEQAVANVLRRVDRPLESLATAPIWHVAGVRHQATDYATGFTRPVAEWARASGEAKSAAG